MIRKIIHIDKEECNGCAACAVSCHEGAINMADGARQNSCGTITVASLVFFTNVDFLSIVWHNGLGA